MLPFPLTLRPVDLEAYEEVAPVLRDPLPPEAQVWVEAALARAARLPPLEADALRAQLSFAPRLAHGAVALGDARGDVWFTLLAASAFPGFVHAAPLLPDRAFHPRVATLGEDDGGYGLWLRWHGSRGFFEADLPLAPVALGHQLHLLDPSELPRVRGALAPSVCPPAHLATRDALACWLDGLGGLGLALSDL